MGLHSLKSNKNLQVYIFSLALCICTVETLSKDQYYFVFEMTLNKLSNLSNLLPHIYVCISCVW